MIFPWVIWCSFLIFPKNTSNGKGSEIQPALDKVAVCLSCWAQRQVIDMKAQSEFPEVTEETGENLTLVQAAMRPRHLRKAPCMGSCRTLRCWLCAEGSPSLPHILLRSVGTQSHGLGNATISTNSTNRVALRDGSVSGAADAAADLCSSPARLGSRLPLRNLHKDRLKKANFLSHQINSFWGKQSHEHSALVLP